MPGTPPWLGSQTLSGCAFLSQKHLGRPSFYLMAASKLVGLALCSHIMRAAGLSPGQFVSLCCALCGLACLTMVASASPAVLLGLVAMYYFCEEVCSAVRRVPDVVAGPAAFVQV